MRYCSVLLRIASFYFKQLGVILRIHVAKLRSAAGGLLGSLSGYRGRLRLSRAWIAHILYCLAWCSVYICYSGPLLLLIGHKNDSPCSNIVAVVSLVIEYLFRFEYHCRDSSIAKNLDRFHCHNRVRKIRNVPRLEHVNEAVQAERVARRTD